MKMIPFFSDEIVIVPHTATHEIHVGAPVSLREFGLAQSISLYEINNNGVIELRAQRTDGAFIEGLEREPSPPASVQIQTTIHDEHGVEVCSQHDMQATHWSVYIRGKDGLAAHVKDFPLNADTKLEGNRGMARTSALCLAARLSMENQVPIETIR